MGLDMYLTAERYASEYRESDAKLVEAFKALPINQKIGRVKTIVADVMYWRKANAIHKWFVDNVQDGEDNCDKYWLSIHQLKELLAVCKEVYANKDKADELLPTGAGFFFGGVEYDDWYFEGIKDTIDRLEEVLALPEEELAVWDFHYQSSW